MLPHRQHVCRRPRAGPTQEGTVLCLFENSLGQKIDRHSMQARSPKSRTAYAADEIGYSVLLCRCREASLTASLEQVAKATDHDARAHRLKSPWRAVRLNADCSTFTSAAGQEGTSLRSVSISKSARREVCKALQTFSDQHFSSARSAICDSYRATGCYASQEAACSTIV